MNIKLFRKALIDIGMSQNELARCMGIHPQVLSSLVRGYRQPSEELMDKIAALLQSDPNVLFELKQMAEI